MNPPFLRTMKYRGATSGEGTEEGTIASRFKLGLGGVTRIVKLLEPGEE